MKPAMPHSTNGNSLSVMVAQIGARRQYAIPRILYEHGILARLYTDICSIKSWPRFLHAIPHALRPNSVRRLLGRTPRGIPTNKVSAFTELGWKTARRLSSCQSAEDVSRVYLATAKDFGLRVIDGGFGDATATYTFDKAGLEIMQVAKARGLATIMEQTIAPAVIEQQLLLEEARKFPEWTCDLPTNSYVEAIRRETEEWEISDVILCGSEFVKDGIRIAGGPVEKCVVVPYGIDSTRFSDLSRDLHDGPLRVLTVGSVGLRKGTPYILAAAAALRNLAEFRLVGPGLLPAATRSRLPENVRWIGQVPHSQIHQQFGWADVFLLPTVCEGSAGVTYEALASGVPVVTTTNAGSIIRNGVDGFLVSAGNADEIVERLCHCARDRDLLADLSSKAQARREYASLDAYAARLVSALIASY